MVVAETVVRSCSFFHLGFKSYASLQTVFSPKSTKRKRADWNQEDVSLLQDNVSGILLPDILFHFTTYTRSLDGDRVMKRILFTCQLRSDRSSFHTLLMLGWSTRQSCISYGSSNLSSLACAGKVLRLSRTWLFRPGPPQQTGARCQQRKPSLFLFIFFF